VAKNPCFAAHEKLDKMVVLLGSNDVTLDKLAEYTQSEDVGMRVTRRTARTMRRTTAMTWLRWTRQLTMPRPSGMGSRL